MVVVRRGEGNEPACLTGQHLKRVCPVAGFIEMENTGDSVDGEGKRKLAIASAFLSATQGFYKHPRGVDMLPPR